ncbi:lamin tail domain-containing protein [Nocardioides sp. LHG3406-4]|uniref:lamin tail domain-containing protein n=1 Tax=Nocardioides sp. LHG3406-4 TaxID=2804575 RepID=UPI003CEC4E75
MSRPPAGERHTAPHTRKLVGTLVVFALSFVALVAMPQGARAADVVDVPDVTFKAVLNNTIASTTGTSRTPDQDISPADALTVTSVQSYDDGVVSPIADFTGVAAFPNLNDLTIYNAAGTISLEPFAESSIQTLSLQPANSAGTISSDLSALGSMSNLDYLTLRYYSLPDAKLQTLPEIPTLQDFIAQYAGITDVSPVTKLANLTRLDVQGNQIRDLSPVAAMSDLRQLAAPENSVADISFLADMKALTGLVLSNNLIEDVSPLSLLADKSEYDLNFSGQTIDVSQNRVADLSPLVGFIGGPSMSTFGQKLYAGPYQDGGVPIKLRTWQGEYPTVVLPTDAGSYDNATDRLISNDPAAPFLDVIGDGNYMWTVYFSEAPERLAGLRVNEVESNGDAANGDWVELYNPASVAVDLGGLVVADSDDTHKIVVPAGTTIPAKGYETIRTDDPAVTGQFGLGSGDSVRIFAPGTTDLTTAPIDAYTWTAHATTTYGRTLPGAGVWATTSGGTLGAVNEFPPPTVIPTVAVTGDATSTTGSAALTATVTKPDSTDLATDAGGTVVFAVDGNDVSGPVTVTAGKADWTADGLAGSPSGTAHQVTARYVSSGDADPYDDSVSSAPFTVTVTVGEFAGAPTLSTTSPRYCDTVTSAITGITPAPDRVTYQWQLINGSGSGYDDIAGATSPSHPMYTVSGTTVDVTLQRAYRLLVTVYRPGYAAKSWALQTAAVGADEWSTESKRTPVLSTTSPKVGETITATHEAWATCLPATLNYQPGYAYQWLRDGQPIAGATDEATQGIGGAGPKKVSYAVTPADLGHKISLQVRGIRIASQFAGSSTESASTAAVTAGAFTSAPAPTIDNVSPKVGDTLTASTMAWSPVASMAYQWLRDGESIAGATSVSYTTTAADAGHALSVKVTGTAEGHATAEKTSGATAKVAQLVFSSAPAPVIGGGTPTVGDTLTATVAAWAPVASFTWEWLRDGQPITGATSASYTVAADDQGHTLSVKVTGSAEGYETASKASAATAQVVNKPPTQVKKSVTSKYSVKVTAAKGKKLRLSVTAMNVPVSLLDKKITVKVAGVDGSYPVKLRDGKATLALGSKAKNPKNTTKVKVTLTLTKLTTEAKSSTSTTVTTTTYTVAKATKTVKVRLK